jgi:hypothetical protein
VAKGDELKKGAEVVDLLAAYQCIDTISLRQSIADQVIKGKKYPF